MERKNFKNIIKNRSFWTIDRRKGNYKLPSGCRLSDYVLNLIETQLELDNLGISKNGNCYYYDKTNNFLIVPFGENEPTTEEQQVRRINNLCYEIILNNKR